MERSFISLSGKVGQSLTLLALLALLLCAYTRNNNFPFYYHTDEPGKVSQIIDGTRNYRHPLLLIDATDAAVNALQIQKTPQGIVHVGRCISALAAALAIAGVVLFTRRHIEWTFALLAGAIAGSHPFLFEATHYMKEDCVMLAGLIWSLYGLDYFCDSGSKTSILICGFAAGVAASGKYLGVVALLLAIGVVVYKGGGWKRRAGYVGLLCTIFIATFLAVNFRAVVHFSDAINGIGAEFHRINRDRSSALFASNYFLRLFVHSGQVLVLGVLTYFVTFFRERKKTIEWALLIFVLIYVTALCFTPLAKDRYLIPIVTLFAIFAVLGIRSIAQRFPRVPHFGAAVVACVVLIACQLPWTFLEAREFQRDVRTEMAQWIRDHLPADAVIAHDLHAWPGVDPKEKVTQRQVSPVLFSAELQNIDNMKRLGITHVVVTGRLYRGVVGEGHQAPDNAFYKEVETNGVALWQVPPGRILYLSPGLTIYALPNATAN
jgi:Dolichyl-phosphate-mannose-protein mannosyltransferase